MNATKFSFTESGSLMHVISKACVRPSSYPVSNEDTTLVVFSAECNFAKNKFEYVTGKLDPFYKYFFHT